MDHETGAEFKKSVVDALKPHLPEGVKFSTIAEAWYDG